MYIYTQKRQYLKQNRPRRYSSSNFIQLSGEGSNRGPSNKNSGSALNSFLILTSSEQLHLNRMRKSVKCVYSKYAPTIVLVITVKRNPFFSLSEQDLLPISPQVNNKRINWHETKNQFRINYRAEKKRQKIVKACRRCL